MLGVLLRSDVNRLCGVDHHPQDPPGRLLVRRAPDPLGTHRLRTDMRRKPGTVYPSRKGSNPLYGALRAASFPKISFFAKLTRYGTHRDCREISAPTSDAIVCSGRTTSRSRRGT
jgi:hypothetical protein